MVTKTMEEWDAMSPDQQRAHLADEEMTVFGRTKSGEPAFKKVKGIPQELGVGSRGHESLNHFTSIQKYHGEEAYQEALEEIWKRDPARAGKLGLPKPKAKAKAA